jgi:CBS domain-containing protein
MVRVKDLMSKHIVGVAAGTTVDSARMLMNSMHVELIPVIFDGKLQGILIDSDIKDMQGSDKVGQIMRKPLFVEAESDLREAAKKMVENALGRLPVVDNKNSMHCVGIISTTDIVRSLE